VAAKPTKNVSRQRYTTPETHGSATATRNGQQAEVVCLLFLFVVRRVLHRKLQCTSPVCFLLFFTEQKLGLGLALGRRGRLWSGDLPALSEANSRSTTEAVCGRVSGRIVVSFFILFLEQIDR
jgi:hypothetical protein